MNRREALQGIFGVAAVAAIGPCVALDQPIGADMASLQEAWVKVFVRMQSDIFAFGQAMIHYTDTFPFIENVALDQFLQNPDPTKYKLLML